MANHLALFLVCEAILFVLTMALAANKQFVRWAEYSGTAFHLFLLGVVGTVAAPLIGVGSGLLWIASDVIASTGRLWNQSSQTADRVFVPIRMAGHLFAAIWIVSVSLQLGTVVATLGIVLALGFATCTLAGGRLPEKFLAVPGVLLLSWFLVLAWKAHLGTLSTFGIPMTK